MCAEYFVLVTDQYFGVFCIDAQYYPELFKDNLHCVKCMRYRDITSYLLSVVGRNALIKSRFKMPIGIGQLYHR